MSQLSKHEVDITRELGQVSTHAEREIGLLKLKYQFLKSSLPVSLLSPGDECSVIDKIVTVCAALRNCCESVVPFE